MKQMTESIDRHALRTSRAYTAYGDRPPSGYRATTGHAGQVAEGELGIYILGARPYLPTLRCFARADRLSPFEAGGANRYAYCGGDPINRVDPTGKAFWNWLSAAARWVEEEVRSIQSAIVSTVVARSAGTSDAAAVSGRADPLVAAAPGTARSPHGNLVLSPGPFGLKSRRYRRQTITLSNGAVVNHYTFSTNAVSRRMRSERQFSTRLDPDSRQEIPHLEPIWHPVPNRAGGYVYLADSMVNARDVIKLVGHLSGPYGDAGKRISILYGAHGYVGGEGNWADLPLGRFRRAEDPELVSSYAFGSARIQAAAGNRPVSFTNMAGMSPSDLNRHMNRDEHVVYATCFGATDEEVMGMLNMRRADAYVLV